MKFFLCKHTLKSIRFHLFICSLFIGMQGPDTELIYKGIGLASLFNSAIVGSAESNSKLFFSKQCTWAVHMTRKRSWARVSVLCQVNRGLITLRYVKYRIAAKRPQNINFLGLSLIHMLWIIWRTLTRDLKIISITRPGVSILNSFS